MLSRLTCLIALCWCGIIPASGRKLFGGQQDTIKIYKDGTARIPQNLRLSGNKVKEVFLDVAELDEWSAEEILRARKAIGKNLGEALAFLQVYKKNSPLGLYDTIWTHDTVLALETEMSLLKAAVERSGAYASPSGISVLTDLEQEIAGMTGRRFYRIESKEVAGNLEIKVFRQSAYNDLITRYYNRVVAHGTNAPIAQKTSLTELDAMAEAAVPLGEAMKDALDVLRGNQISASQLDLVYSLYLTPPTDLENYTGAPWFAQWLWKTGGRLNTTPLGFTSDEGLRLPAPVYKKEQHALFDSFLTKATLKYLEDSNARDASVYKQQVLDNMGRKDLFTKTEAVKKAEEENRKRRNEVLADPKLRNHLAIPLIDGERSSEYVYYSATEPLRFQRQRKLRPVSTDDLVKVTVYNISSDDSVKVVKASEKEIVDQSRVTEGLNSSLDMLSTALASPITASVTSLLQSLNVERELGRALVGEAQETVGAIEKGIDARRQLFSLESKQINEVMSHVYGVEGGKDPEYKLTPGQLRSIKGKAKALHNSILNDPANSFNDVVGVRAIVFDEGFVDSLGKNLRFQTAAGADSQILLLYEYYLITTHVAPLVSTVTAPELSRRSRIIDTMSVFLLASSAPMPALEQAPSSAPELYTSLAHTELGDKAMERTHDVSLTQKTGDQKLQSKLGTFSYKSGKRYWIQASIGLAYTTEEVRQTTARVENGQVKLDSKNEQFGVVAALHFYPVNGGVFLQDRRFFGEGARNVWARVNFMAGVDFRNVPDDIYLGLGYDFGPGIRVNAGVRLYKYHKYEIRNDVIVSDQRVYRPAFPFVYLGIDPVSFVKAINIFD